MKIKNIKNQFDKRSYLEEVQWELADLLSTAQIQINEARDMGWLPE